jgi:hypothetical protein
MLPPRCVSDLFPPWTLALERNPDADFSFGRFDRFSGHRPPSPSDLWDEEFVPTHDPRRLVVKLMENCFLPKRAFTYDNTSSNRESPLASVTARAFTFWLISGFQSHAAVTCANGGLHIRTARKC